MSSYRDNPEGQEFVDSCSIEEHKAYLNLLRASVARFTLGLGQSAHLVAVLCTLVPTISTLSTLSNHILRNKRLFNRIITH